MPRLLLVGCGYVGQATADLFHGAGWAVEAWTGSAASAAELASKPYRVIACDASDAGTVTTHGGEFEVVIQCVSSAGGNDEDYRRVYLQTAENLTRVHPSATLIFTGSTSVYAQEKGEWVDEKSAAEPDRATAQVLRETEQLVLAHCGIVTRIAGIYGPGRSALLKKFLRNEGLHPEAENRFRNYAHRDDIAAALLLLAERRGQLDGEKIFNIADDLPMTGGEVYAALSELLKKPLPPPATEGFSRKRGDSNKRVSNAKLRQLGWRPRYPSLPAGLRESVIPGWNF